MNDDTEHKYRAVIGELSLLLALERRPRASGEELLINAGKIAADMFQRFGLAPELPGEVDRG